ncbi:MAG: signal peptidase I [Planctomycetota bacterium]|nr:MAG: signal peptidase I [Planctomycetota bacterium]
MSFRTARPSLSARIRRSFPLFGALIFGSLLLAFRVAPVRGGSMEPTLQDGQWLCYQRYWLPQQLQRGDLVVFDSPVAQGHRYVKRLVGLPGDELRFARGRLWVNGERLNLPRGAVPFHQILSVRVPEGSFFAIGDHGAISFDCRRIGPVPEHHLVGRVVGPLTRPKPELLATESGEL